jgi:hypothetical protein
MCQEGLTGSGGSLVGFFLSTKDLSPQSDFFSKEAEVQIHAVWVTSMM